MIVHAPSRAGRVALAVAVVLSVLMLFSPGDATPSGPPGSDKVVHVLIFAVLAFTSRSAGLRVGVTVAWCVAYAALSEVLQATLPIHRAGSVWDLCADVVGVAAGLLAWRVAATRPSAVARRER